MSVLADQSVACACGAISKTRIADTINAGRSPSLKHAILDGTLHRARCGECGTSFTVEKPFVYVDFGQNVAFEVRPRGDRHASMAISQRLDHAIDAVPEPLWAGGPQMRRVVFGMDELREKIVALENALDDRVVELSKVFIVNEHPFLTQTPRLRLTLASVTPEAAKFRATYEHSPRKFDLSVPRGVFDELTSQEPMLRDWVGRNHAKSLFDDSERWVNLWRWSPQPNALSDLRDYADAVRRGENIRTSAAKFKRMLRGLPRGNHLPSRAKRDLSVLFRYAKQKGYNRVQESLFEIRFGVGLEDDWSSNDFDDDIDSLWKLLRDLPDNNVEGNVFINEILIDDGEGGGWYDPTKRDIAIGEYELSDPASFELIVRHEVGHAVHEMRSSSVDEFLADRFGWKTFGANDDNAIDAWAAEMGGWGGASSSEITEMRNALRYALSGPSSFSPGPAPFLPAGHSWRDPACGPRLAYEKTGPNWFQNHSTWHRHDGKAFFLNYWYKTLICVDQACLEFVAQMPSSYAAMSHFEFFAELYAFYYDLDHPDRGVIPDDVANWFEATISDAAPMRAARPAAPADKQDWEGVKRPRRG